MAKSSKSPTPVRQTLRFPPRWAAAAFSVGFATMAGEILWARRFAPYFGSSVPVWGILIASVLAASTGGYLLGARLAEPSPRRLAGLLIGAAAALGVAFVVSSGALPALATWHLVAGASVGSILLAAPFTVMASGAVPQLAALASRDVARGAGAVLAWGSLGSLVGTLGAALGLVPYLGLRWTAAVAAGALGAAAVGLAARRDRLGFGTLLAAVVVAAALAPMGSRTDVLYDAESIEGRVRVVKRGPHLALVLGEDLAPQTEILAGERGDAALFAAVSPDHYIHLMTTLAGAIEARQVLVLGLGGGLAVRELLRTLTDARVTAVELNGRVIEAARTYFGLPENPRVTVVHADARRFVASDPVRYDVVEIDVYSNSGLQIPAHLATAEFFHAVRERLRPSGLLATNTIAYGGDRRVADAIGATLAAVFPTVLEAPSDRGINRLLVAAPGPVDLSALRNQLVHAGERAPLLSAAANHLARHLVAAPAPVRPPLTDDRSDLDLLGHALLARVRAHIRVPPP